MWRPYFSGFLGVAQLLMSIAKIEFYASTQKNQAILRSLHNIEITLNHSEKRRMKPEPTRRYSTTTPAVTDRACARSAPAGSWLT